MNQYRSLRVSFPVIIVFLLQSCASVFTPAETQIRKATWSTQEVAEGVVWKYYHFDDLFDAKQSVTVLEVDPGRVDTRVDYVDSGFFRTSDRASDAGAVAAINGSFFNTKRGGAGRRRAGVSVSGKGWRQVRAIGVPPDLAKSCPVRKINHAPVPWP